FPPGDEAEDRPDRLRPEQLRRLHFAGAGGVPLDRGRRNRHAPRSDAVEPARDRRIPRREEHHPRGGPDRQRPGGGRRRARGVSAKAVAAIGPARIGLIAPGRGIRMDPGVAADPRRLLLGASAFRRRDGAVASHPRPRRALLVVLALGQPIPDASLTRSGRRAAIRKQRPVARVLALAAPRRRRVYAATLSTFAINSRILCQRDFRMLPNRACPSCSFAAPSLPCAPRCPRSAPERRPSSNGSAARRRCSPSCCATSRPARPCAATTSLSWAAAPSSSPWPRAAQSSATTTPSLSTATARSETTSTACST